MASGLREYAGIGKKTLDFFFGGGRIKLVSELGKSSRKGVIVFKG